MPGVTVHWSGYIGHFATGDTPIVRAKVVGDGWWAWLCDYQHSPSTWVSACMEALTGGLRAFGRSDR